MRNCLLVALVVYMHLAAISLVHAQATGEPDSQAKVAVARLDSLGDKLPLHADYRFGTQRFQHPGSVIDMVLSPDEKMIVTYGQNRLIAWETQTGKQLWKEAIEEHSLTAYGVRSLALSVDSGFLYSTSQPKTLLKWNLASGDSEKIIYNHDLQYLPNNRPVGAVPGVTRSIDVTQDGTRIAAAGPHGVVVCNSKGKRLFEIANNPAGIFNQSEPGTEEEATRLEQTELETLQAKELQLADQVAKGHPALDKLRQRIAMLKEHITKLRASQILELAKHDRLWAGGHYCLAIFSPNGKQLAVVASGSPHRLRLYDVSNGAATLEFKSTANIVRFCFSPDGRSIATTERDNAVRQYSTENGRLTWTNVVGLEVDSKSYTTAVAYRPDGKQVIAGASIDGKNGIVVLESKTGEVVATLNGIENEPWALAITKDSKTLYSSGSDGSIRRWSLETYRQLGPPQGLRGSSVIAAQSNGDKIAFVDDLGSVHVVNAADGKTIQSFAEHPFRPTQLVFSLDNQWLACGGVSESEIVVLVWSLKEDKTIQRFTIPIGKGLRTALQALVISPDSSRMAVATHQPSAAKLWDLASGAMVAELPHPEISGVSFSRDSQSLVTVGWDTKLNFWNSTNGQLHSTHDLSKLVVGGTETRLRHAIFSPTQDSLATSHLDGTVRIWSSKDMSLKRQFTIPRAFASSSIAYSPDGKWLATGSGLGEVTLWDDLSGKAAWTVGKHESPVATVGFAQHGQRLVSASRDGLGYCWNLNPHRDAEVSFDSMWQNLSPLKAITAEADLHLSLWAMIKQGDRSIESIAERLKPLRTLVDLHQVAKGVDGQEGYRRQSLLMQLVEKDAKVEFKSRVQLALYALVKIDTRQSLELLHQIQGNHSCKAVRDLATEALAIRDNGNPPR